MKISSSVLLLFLSLDIKLLNLFYMAKEEPEEVG